MHGDRVPRSSGRKRQAKADASTRRNVIHERERVMGDLTGRIQDVGLEPNALEAIQVVIVQDADDRSVAITGALQLPLDLEEPFLGRGDTL
jgi:hypothetical protein